MNSRKHRWLLITALVVLVPCVIPEHASIPVQGATTRDWNPRSFWYEPWGASGVHKGIDIFAPKGRAVVAPVAGLVIYRGRLSRGGNVVAVLGPKWRVHYGAHLDSFAVRPFQWVARSTPLGTVGTSGNAAGKPPHLHYSVVSLLPRVWQLKGGTQGWKRMFFVDPGTLFQDEA